MTEGREAASKEASFPSLFNLKLLLSCVATRSQTLRCGPGGWGWLGECWAQWHNAALCLHRTASCGMILPRMRSLLPSPTMDGGSVLHPHIFHFSTWKVCWPCGQVSFSSLTKKKNNNKGDFLLQQWTYHMKRQTMKTQPLTERRQLPSYTGLSYLLRWPLFYHALRPNWCGSRWKILTEYGRSFVQLEQTSALRLAWIQIH